MKYHFFTTCVDCGAPNRRDKLDSMVAGETGISRRTFMFHCGESAREVFRELGYADHPKQGLTAAGDYHISYHRSKWGAQRCYYFRWSAIEHIFVSERPADG